MLHGNSRSPDGRVGASALRAGGSFATICSARAAAASALRGGGAYSPASSIFAQ